MLACMRQRPAAVCGCTLLTQHGGDGLCSAAADTACEGLSPELRRHCCWGVCACETLHEMQVLLGCGACCLRVQAKQAVGAAPDIAEHNGQAGRPLRSRVLRLRVGGLHPAQRHAPKLLCHPIGWAGSAPTTVAAAAASCCCCSKLGSGGEGLVTAAAFDRLGVLPVAVTAVCQEGNRAERVSKGCRQSGRQGEMPPTCEGLLPMTGHVLPAQHV